MTQSLAKLTHFGLIFIHVGDEGLLRQLHVSQISPMKHKYCTYVSVKYDICLTMWSESGLSNEKQQATL